MNRIHGPQRLTQARRLKVHSSASPRSKGLHVVAKVRRDQVDRYEISPQWITAMHDGDNELLATSAQQDKTI